MFLIGNIPGNLITALEFHLLKWLLIYGSKRVKYWFSHIFHCNFTTMAFTEVKLWFLSSLEHFWPDPQDTLSKVALFFEKMHKVFKNKAQGCSSPFFNWVIFLKSINISKTLRAARYCLAGHMRPVGRRLESPAICLRNETKRMVYFAYFHLKFAIQVLLLGFKLGWQLQLLNE